MGMKLTKQGVRQLDAPKNIRRNKEQEAKDKCTAFAVHEQIDEWGKGYCKRCGYEATEENEE